MNDCMMNPTTYLRRIPFVNYDWLPIKAHYFFFFGAVAAVYSFMPVIGKDIGLNATALGISSTALPTCIFIFKPIFGYIGDAFKNIKIIVISLIIATVLLLGCVYFIKPLPESESLTTYLQCVNKTEKLTFSFDEYCFRELQSVDKIDCTVSLQYISTHKNALTESIIQAEAELSCSNNNRYSPTENIAYVKVDPSRCVVLFAGNISKIEGVCDDSSGITASILECNYDLKPCLAPQKKVGIYTSYQFWIFTLLLVSSGTFLTTGMSLTDVACYEILAEERQHYGRQRLWGTIGTGVSTGLAGYLNDIIAEEGEANYTGCYYVMVTFLIANMTILVNTDLPKAKLSKNIMSDIKTLIKAPEFIVYGVSVFVIGCFSGLLMNYLFWHLKDLGANQTLIGLVVTMQCLSGEVPFFYFGGWFVKQLGYFNCLTCSFAAYGLRFWLYSILKNPWLTLPIEILHGVTFAVFYVSKTAFASVYAPPGTEGTVLGILGGLCDGLGYAFGSFMSGYSYDRLGGSKTFLIACGLGLVCAPATFVAHFVFKKKSSPEVEMKEDTRKA